MANVSNKLVDSGIKTAQARKAPYKLSDGEGMYLLVTPAGSKYWRLKYRFAGREKVLAMGVYPDVGLADARVKRTDARKLLTDNIDPGLAKKEQAREECIRAGNTFEGMAREWHEKQKHKWTKKHSAQVLTSLELNIFPSLGGRPVAEITAAELLDVLRMIENRGALEIASRVLQRCSAVFRYAIASQRTRTNPAADLKGALKAPKRKHYSALAAKDLPEFLEKLAQFDGYETTKLAIHLLMLTFVRTGELRVARWEEFDLVDKMWRIPGGS